MKYDYFFGYALVVYCLPVSNKVLSLSSLSITITRGTGSFLCSFYLINDHVTPSLRSYGEIIRDVTLAVAFSLLTLPIYELASEQWNIIFIGNV